ncbi:MAG TPA: UDP-N-acetylmuramoyl-L-alanyl-D-glutamate--2,6-diaminopimelate ligase [Terriglobales bacterium]|nr:UDP-N-acetylmuramoyl-L-alanyl-D-glutamate--2,6-diaminopimelate ligase [Terriglobales bacterium]
MNDLIGGLDSVATLRSQAGAVVITGLTADSRAVRPGYLFAALPGNKMDGRDFIPAALAQGAAAILLPEGSDLPQLPDNIALATAANPRRALALLAARFNGRQPKTIAAVTGTSGKTSTTVFTRQLWTLLGMPAASLGTVGLVAPGYELPDSLTTPDPVELHRILGELAKRNIDHLAMEASSHGLDQFRLDGVQVTAAAFTNLSRDHLDYHGNMQAYLKAKLRLFNDLLPAGGTAVINADMAEAGEITAACRARHHRLITIGRAGNDIRLLEQVPTSTGQELTIDLFGERHTVAFPVAGLFQAYNLLTAMGLVIGSGAEPRMVVEMICRLTGVHGRIERVATTPKGGAVYVDYAHKPDALQAVLTALRPHATGKLVVVVGCGGDRDKGKRPIMGEIATRLADRTIVTDDNPRTEDPATIRREVMAGAPGATEIGDRTEAITTAMRDLGAGDVLVIAGKGHETYQIIGTVKHDFDDSQVARDVAAQLEGEAR